VQYADKSTLANSAVLGIIPSTHIDQNQFNWLGTVFYVSD
jgi:ACS family allantoate permease-like MFS transporter